jgi:hypothetical protein
MWDWLSNLDWPGIVKALLIAAGGGILTVFGYSIRESRRRINFSAKDLYYGPAMHANNFMGRNYPSEDRIGFDCDLSFFSNKSVATGLHKFQLEFCRESYIGRVVEFEPDMTFVLKDMHAIGTPGASHSLKKLDLPSRQFETMHLSSSFGREDWDALRSCTVVRLRCETPEGKKKRFTIGRIKFPDMPPAGFRGLEYCGMYIVSTAGYGKTPPSSYDGKVVIATIRRQTMLGPRGQMFPSDEDTRYWTGTGWSRSLTDAKVYPEMKVARSEGEAVKIWNSVPEEWRNDERKP